MIITKNASYTRFSRYLKRIPITEIRTKRAIKRKIVSSIIEFEISRMTTTQSQKRKTRTAHPMINCIIDSNGTPKIKR